MTSPDDVDDGSVEDVMQLIAALNSIANTGISDGTLKLGDPVTTPRIEERIARMDDEEMRIFRQRANGLWVGDTHQLDWNEDRKGYDLGERVNKSAHN